MVDPEEPHVVDLRAGPDDAGDETAEYLRARRPGLAVALAIAVVFAAVGVVVLAGGDDQPDATEETPGPSAISVAPPGADESAAAVDDRPSGGATGLVTATIAPVRTPVMMMVATRPIDDGPLDFVAVDSTTGIATFLDNRSLLGLEAIDDVRFFGPDRAVAQLVDGTYLTLRLTEDRVDVDALMDVAATAAATPLGLDALSPDGRFAWVASPYGFFRWDLAEDRIVDRWLDRDGDLERLPEARLALEAGLVVEAGGETYLIESSTARQLAVDGAVVAGADDWVLTRRCDESLDCGDLELVHVTSSATIELRDERFRQRCGLMAAVPDSGGSADDAVVVVLQRFGSSAVVLAGTDGIESVTPLHPLPVGCVDATVVDGGQVVVFSDTTIAFVSDGIVEIATTFPLGRTIAGTAWAADR